jgi:integrase
MRAPYTGMGAINLLSRKRMSQEGIAKDGAVRSGPHSLRHALATNMLDAEIPLPVISAVLGHSSTASTSVYLHSNIEGPRRYALDTEGGSHEY